MTCCVGEAENMGGVAHGDGAGVWWPTKQTEGRMAGRSDSTMGYSKTVCTLTIDS